MIITELIVLLVLLFTLLADQVIWMRHGKSIIVGPVVRWVIHERHAAVTRRLIRRRWEMPVAGGPVEELATIQKIRFTRILFVTRFYAADMNKPTSDYAGLVKKRYRIGSRRAIRSAHYEHYKHLRHWELREYNCETHGPQYRQAVRESQARLNEMRKR